MIKLSVCGFSNLVVVHLMVMPCNILLGIQCSILDLSLLFAKVNVYDSWCAFLKENDESCMKSFVQFRTGLKMSKCVYVSR